MNIEMKEICYGKNFISEAISKVEFLTPIVELSDSLPKEFSDSIKDSFPIAESKEITNNVVELTDKGAVNKVAEKSTEWTFWNKERNKKILLSNNSILLVQNVYNTYNEFENEFMIAFKSICKIFPDLTFKRYGMRFINNIKIDEKNPLDWGEYINENLIASINIPKDKENISRTFHTLEMNYDVFNLRFNFGIHNPDYPAIIKQKVFILDLDVYHYGIQNSEEIINSMNIFHAKIQEFFEFSITPKFRNKYLNNGQ